MSDYGRVWEECRGGIEDARRNAKKVMRELAAKDKPSAADLDAAAHKLQRYAGLIKQYENELKNTTAQDR